MQGGFGDAAKGRRKPAKAKIRLGLALQGGGSYGAFTKGVLKALLESDLIQSRKVQITDVAGTSAGAVNGALLTYGMNAMGPKRTIKILDSFWNDVKAQGVGIRHVASMFNPLASNWPNLPPSMLSTMRAYGQFWMSNGAVPKKLKHMLGRYIKNEDRLHNGKVNLYVNAMRENGEQRFHHVFKDADLSLDAIVASGTLSEFGAYRFDGHDHYDGAYWRNPCFDDIEQADITDMLVVTLHRKPSPENISPCSQDDLRGDHEAPGHELVTDEIHHHLAHLDKQKKHFHLHNIELEVENGWDDTSRMNTDPSWIEYLEERGYEAGRKWLEDNAPFLGKKSTYKGPDSRARAKKPAPVA